MATVTVKRKKPSLDMTPMVDLGFLLVTFFMLTTQFLAQDIVQVAVPHSVSQVKLPESDIMTVLVSRDGQIFFGTDGQENRKDLIARLNEKYALELSPREIENFASISSIGIPLGSIKPFLDLTPDEQKEIKQPGIPCDSLKNELSDWLVFTRITNPNARLALKADRETPYPVIKNVLNTFQEVNIDRFSMITDAETIAIAD
jgi:biopolymer transport protein ExbD